jgi:hypothetical protein
MCTRIFSIAALLLLFSCTKEEENESKMSILTEKAWKFVKVESRTNNGPWFDEAQFWPACKKDDEILFKTNLSYVLSNGATKCTSSDPDVFDIATWKFLDNETKIDMDGAVTSIEKLDHQEFIISASQTQGSDTYYNRYTLQH